MSPITKRVPYLNSAQSPTHITKKTDSKHPAHNGNSLGSSVQFVQTEQLTVCYSILKILVPGDNSTTQLGESRCLALQGDLWVRKENPLRTKGLLFIFQEGVGRDRYTSMPGKK